MKFHPRPNLVVPVQMKFYFFLLEKKFFESPESFLEMNKTTKTDAAKNNNKTPIFSKKLIAVYLKCKYDVLKKHINNAI